MPRKPWKDIGEPPRQYYCPISVICPHWDTCRPIGCQHPDAIEMRQEAAMVDLRKMTDYERERYFAPSRFMIRVFQWVGIGIPAAALVWTIIWLTVSAIMAHSASGYVGEFWR